ncbi:putative GEM-like protein 8 [Dioscorea cayenensis subsp. rotundata]|uniref:GEM-like protein 8 n=1 Tax=Dioscorea cayennensis subsp. rotundata TaxID=55577 RepID=A0AB40C8M7_DIOCR|nr:putative GEM-like protein 8 [Dioscorea cayenensis subsp. rotundata]
MKNFYFDHHAIGIPVNSVANEESACVVPRTDSYLSTQFKRNTLNSVINHIIKLSKRADSYAQGIRDHVSLGPKISETVKGKLRLGTRILQARGLERVFRKSFNVGEDEKLIKAFQCHLSTSAGPIAGLLYISTEKIAFHSDMSFRFTSSKGNTLKSYYKVLIPLGRIKRANPSENGSRPNQKYIQIVTEDEFEFWFMGFLSYQRSFKYLQHAITEVHMSL